MEMNHGMIMSLIDELATECVNRGIQGTVMIYGGCAMVFHHPELRTTQDVDSMFRPYTQIAEVARSIAENHLGMNPHWLNMQVRDVLPLKADDDAVTYFDQSGFII